MFATLSVPLSHSLGVGCSWIGKVFYALLKRICVLMSRLAGYDTSAVAIMMLFTQSIESKMIPEI